MPFAYYRRLSRTDQATYRASDGIARLSLPAPAALTPYADALRGALEADDKTTAQRAATKLTNALLAQLGHAAVTVRVLSVRPSLEDGELHGYYEHVEGQRPVIRVWMRTVVHRRPVAYRTFLRTLLHEICHHLDYVHLGLDASFHTEGFFQREAHLTRQLLATQAHDETPHDETPHDETPHDETPHDEKPAKPSSPRRTRGTTTRAPKAAQLELAFAGPPRTRRS